MSSGNPPSLLALQSEVSSLSLWVMYLADMVQRVVLGPTIHQDTMHGFLQPPVDEPAHKAPVDDRTASREAIRGLVQDVALWRQFPTDELLDKIVDAVVPHSCVLPERADRYELSDAERAAALAAIDQFGPDARAWSDDILGDVLAAINEARGFGESAPRPVPPRRVELSANERSAAETALAAYLPREAHDFEWPVLDDAIAAINRVRGF